MTDCASSLARKEMEGERARSQRGPEAIDPFFQVRLWVAPSNPLSRDCQRGRERAFHSIDRGVMFARLLSPCLAWSSAKVGFRGSFEVADVFEKTGPFKEMLVNRPARNAQRGKSFLSNICSSKGTPRARRGHFSTHTLPVHSFLEIILILPALFSAGPPPLIFEKEQQPAI